MFIGGIKVGTKQQWEVVVKTHDFPNLVVLASIWLVANQAALTWAKKNCPNGTIKIAVKGGWGYSDWSETNEKKQSVFHLLAQSMKKEQSKKIAHFIEYFEPGLKHENNSLSRVLWMMHQLWPLEEGANVDWALSGLDLKGIDVNSDFTIDHIHSLFEDSEVADAWLDRGQRAVMEHKLLFQKGFLEFEEILGKSEHLEKSVLKDGKTWKVYGFRSDNVRIGASIRSLKRNSGIIVQQNSRGNFHVSVNKHSGIVLDEAMAIIRCLENRKAGRTEIVGWDTLRSPGEISATPEWLYFKSANMLINGGVTRPDVPISKLTLKEVFYAVYLSQSPEMFHPKKCTGDVCIKEACDWYFFGRMSCRNKQQILLAV